MVKTSHHPMPSLFLQMTKEGMVYQTLSPSTYGRYRGLTFVMSPSCLPVCIMMWGTDCEEPQQAHGLHPKFQPLRKGIFIALRAKPGASKPAQGTSNRKGRLLTYRVPKLCVHAEFASTFHACSSHAVRSHPSEGEGLPSELDVS